MINYKNIIYKGVFTMKDIKELANELTKKLNSIKEVKEKINLKEEEYKVFFDSVTKKNSILPLSSEIKDKIKEEREKKIFIIDNLKNKLKVLNIEQLALKNNIQYDFTVNNTSCIEEVLNKYVNRRIGEKTKDKIQKELIATLLEKNKNIDNISLYIMIQPYNNKIDITIYINSIQFEVIYYILSGEKWFNDNKEGKIKLTNKYNYIDNIDLYAANLITQQKEIKAEKEKLRKKISIFNDSLKGDKLYSQYNISYSL